MEATVAIAALRSIAQPVIYAAREQLTFPIHFTFKLVLERLESSLGSIEVLLKDDLLVHDHAIGLICRNILSDVIATGYVIKLSNSEEDFYENLYALYQDDLDKVDRFIQTFQESGFFTKQKADQYHKKYSMPESMHKVIRDYAKEFNIKSFPTSTKIIKSLLASKKNDPWSIEIQNSFDIWTYYSKYEHLGWYAYELTRNLDREKAESRLNSVLRLATLLLGSCLEMLEEKEAMDKSMVLYRELLKEPANAINETA